MTARSPRPRRGVALLAALWLVVAIAAVALQFSLEAHERRTEGVLAAERGQQRALAMGALALMQEKLDQSLRVAPSGSNPRIAQLAAFDPWMGADSLYSGTVYVDSLPVLVEVHDLGEKLNVNSATETELQAFFSFLLKDYSASVQLSQTIMDWRDADSIPRPNGAERDDYIKAGMLALPTNSTFRTVQEVSQVMGMTPDIFAEASPYLTTRGNGAINLNTAPVPVLRALPAMTDATLNQILQLRSQGRRITDVEEIFPQQRNGRRGAAGQVASTQAQAALAARTTVTTTQLELTISARIGREASPSVLTAIIQRAGGQGAGVANITYKQW